MNYRLKFNSSDTVYYEDAYFYGNEKRLYYFILEKDEKKILDSLVCNFEFPQDSLIYNNDVNDGTTIAFAVDNKKLILHESGPKQFWKFEETIEYIKLHKKLIPTSRKIEFANLNKLLPALKFEK